MADQFITVRWTEQWQCEHSWPLTEALKFVNDHSDPPLLDTASAEEIRAAMEALDLTNALAELDIAERDQMEVDRTVEEVRRG